MAVSAVQSLDGRVADLDAIAAAADTVGARTFIDGTQASGWLPLDASRFDYCGEQRLQVAAQPARGEPSWRSGREPTSRSGPHLAGWYAGDDPFDTNYGAPLRLAPDARRFDLSPAWLSWVGAAPALAVLEEVGIETIHEHDLGLANRFRAGLGMPPGDSAIVALPAGGLAGARCARRA